MTVQDAVVQQETLSGADALNNAPLLSIQNLRVWFELRRFGFGHAGYVKAVDDVSFDLQQGEAVAVTADGSRVFGKITIDGETRVYEWSPGGLSLIHIS
ncbi:MAG: hypothetical protein N2646_07565, partial [Bellilinea sp.]|nr:hypothetical protein [Bellilinea sp.]